MPELPEVETVRRGLIQALDRKRIREVTARRTMLRRPLPENFAERLRGRRVEAIGRRAKYLLLHLDGDEVLIIHLGMSGRMRIDPPGSNRAPGAGAHDRHEHVVFVMEDGTVLRFSDPRRFGLMALAAAEGLARHPLLARLGPEPLDPGFDGPALAARLKGKRTPIKAALLDQTVVAGLGNIYVCEALFEAGLSPRRLAHTVQGARAARLAAAIHAVLQAAIAAGGSSLRDYVATDGELGYFQHGFKVYGREGQPCPRPGCAGAVRRIVQSGRSSFYCPACQR